MSAVGDRSAIPLEDKLALDRAVRSFSMLQRTGMPVSPDASGVVEAGGERYVLLRNETGAHVATYKCLPDGAVEPEPNPPQHVLRPRPR